MNIKKIIILLISILFLGIMPNFSSEKISDKNILLINAYDPTYVWTEEEVRGITETLDGKFENYNLKIEYMDTKHYNSKFYYMKLLMFYREKYINSDFDAIIVTDDNAFRFVLENREDLFGKIPLFFAGINSMNGYNLENEENIYGLVEKTSPMETLEFALKVNQYIDKIYIVIGYSVTAEQTLHDMKEQFISLPEWIEVEYIRERNLKEIEEYIRGIDEENSIIIMPFFKVDIDGTVYTDAETVRRISNAASMLVYGLHDFQMSHGIIGGKLVAGYYHGKGVVELIEDYFNNELKETIVIRDKKANIYKFDYNQLNKFNINLDILPEGSVIVNQPDTFLEKYKMMLFIISFMALLLSMYIFVLRKQVEKKTVQTELYLNEVINNKKKIIELEKMAGLGEIVVSIAHEINKPLSSVITVASKLEKNLEKLIKRKESENIKIVGLEKVVETSEYSFEIINDNIEVMKLVIDDFKKLNSESDVEIDNINVKKFIEGLIISNKNKFDFNKIKFKFQCYGNLNLITDRKILNRIFTELISNSVTHGLQENVDRVIDIHVKGDDKFLEIVYSDNGIGIEKEVEKEIFNPFYTSNKSKYRGLGLYKVYNLINLLDGSIKYISKGKGATFELKFLK